MVYKGIREGQKENSSSLSRTDDYQQSVHVWCEFRSTIGGTSESKFLPSLPFIRDNSWQLGPEGNTMVYF